MTFWRLAPLCTLVLTAMTACTPAKSDPVRPASSSEAASVTAPRSSRPTKVAQVELPPASKNWATGAIQSPHGVVTSVESSATDVGVAILEAGGNAVDAAVATAFALAVTHQSAASLGGGGFLLLKRDEKIAAFDFREQSPSSLTRAHFEEALRKGAAGPYAVGVPGMVAGLLAVHAEFGSLPREKVLEGAVRLAELGYALGAHQAAALSRHQRELLADPVAKKLFYASGAPPKAGSKLKNLPLAGLLRALAEQGPSAFYSGSGARDLAKTTRFAISEEDLAGYTAKRREPLVTTVGQWTVSTMPPASGGGIVLSEALHLARGLFEKSGALDPNDYHVLAESLRRGHVDRRFSVVAPDSLGTEESRTQLQRFLSPSRHEAHPILEFQHSPSSELDPRYPDALAELEHTTHFAVVDKRGDVVSCTVTLSASFGARLVAPAGFVLNNSLLSFAASGANQPKPNVRTISSMTPTLVTHPSGLTLVLGSPGGDTIPGTVLQVFLRLARGASLAEAVLSPRLHQGFVPDILFVEGNFPGSALSTLKSYGHTVKKRSLIGDANIAIALPNLALAVADFREGGKAEAARPPSP